MREHCLPESGYHNVYYKYNKYTPENKFKYEGSLYRDHFRDIPFLKLKKLLKKGGLDLNGKTVLVASSGSGIDAHYLKKMYSGARLFFSDINLAGMEKLRSNFLTEPAVLSDNHSMAFKDNSFDYVYVAASLHHLTEPAKGLYELLRVAREAIIVIEPNDSWLTDLFVRLGLAHEYEVPHSNYVYRISKKEVEKISRALFFKCGVDRLFAIHRTAKTRIEFLLLRLLNGFANLLFPSMGNYIIFFIRKAASVKEEDDMPGQAAGSRTINKAR